MSSVCGESLFRCVAWSLVLGVLMYLGLRSWISHKSYIFDAEDLVHITNQALKISNSKAKLEGIYQSGDHELTFSLVEEELRNQYSSHILPPSQMEWIFVNAGGWMGAMCLLHASTTEYVIFFGTAVDTSGHSGRYWANISDTIISGKFVQWKEGTTKAGVFRPGDTVYHGVGETAAVQWEAPFWAVEYGRGFIPSTLGFALSDSIFSTQDLYIIYRTFRIYVIALVREIVQGNI